MILSINKDTGTPMFMLDQVLLHQAFKDVYHHFGLHGIHYVILFGWDGSPYRSELDIVKRDEIAYEAVRKAELFDTRKDKLASPTKLHSQMYHNVFMKKALNLINNVVKVPILEKRYFFVKEVDILKSQVEGLDWKSKDPVDKKKTVDTHKVLMESITKYTKDIQNIDDEIASTFKIEKIPSLNDLIDLAHGRVSD